MRGSSSFLKHPWTAQSCSAVVAANPTLNEPMEEAGVSSAGVSSEGKSAFLSACKPRSVDNEGLAACSGLAARALLLGKLAPMTVLAVQEEATQS